MEPQWEALGLEEMSSASEDEARDSGGSHDEDASMYSDSLASTVEQDSVYQHRMSMERCVGNGEFRFGGTQFSTDVSDTCCGKFRRRELCTE